LQGKKKKLKKNLKKSKIENVFDTQKPVISIIVSHSKKNKNKKNKTKNKQKNTKITKWIET